MLSESVARQLAVRHAVRVRGGLAQAGHLILFVRLEVAFEPVPVVGCLLSPLPREDVGSDAVEEPTVVGDDDGAAGECQEGIFQRAESLDVKVVGRLIQQEQIATLLEGESQVQTVALTAGQNAGRLLLVRTLEAKGRDIGTRGHFDIADLDEVQAVRDDLPQRLVRVNTGARLVDIADLDGLADRQLATIERLEADDSLKQSGLTDAIGPMTPTMPLRGSEKDRPLMSERSPKPF